ncbi:CinA family protein [uncultured Nitrosomonas sp.]|uniref:CinA family protein n=1 Tax=uncultured Nitrosomonas sp. TaxID=156424 RepID=UPI0025E5D616|nr:CinA family protein [uncultured Nitrosomonas sp.]
MTRESQILDDDQAISDLALRVGEALEQREWMLATAESCTGGWVGQAVTTVAGSSDWYERGFITYSNKSKCEMLGVQQSTLDQFGSVSPQAAQEMAIGALHRSHAQISVSITGIAGPDGGTATKPVGMVCFAWVSKDGPVQQQTHYFTGDRETIRHSAVTTALQGILDLLDNAIAVA